jgi:carbon starvation protein
VCYHQKSDPLCLVAYISYGSFLAKKLGIDPKNKTLAHIMRDDVDYVPTRAPALLGHHFASIAGAGPIVGPITAGVFD